MFLFTLNLIELYRIARRKLGLMCTPESHCLAGGRRRQSEVVEEVFLGVAVTRRVEFFAGSVI
jgi:hypothetical protein